MSENNLYPVVDIPEYEEENEEYDAEYKPSVAWDLEKGDFVCESPFCMLKSEGLEAYKTWCVRQLLQKGIAVSDTMMISVQRWKMP